MRFSGMNASTLPPPILSAAVEWSSYYRWTRPKRFSRLISHLRAETPPFALLVLTLASRPQVIHSERHGAPSTTYRRQLEALGRSRLASRAREAQSGRGSGSLNRLVASQHRRRGRAAEAREGRAGREGTEGAEGEGHGCWNLERGGVSSSSGGCSELRRASPFSQYWTIRG